MSYPTKITVHQDIYEMALKQANEQGTKIGMYCKSLIAAHPTTAKIERPKGYEYVHNQTGRGVREKDFPTAKINFRMEEDLLNRYKQIMTREQLKLREVIRLVITSKVLKIEGVNA